jgi:N-acetylneuraminate synthase
MPPTAGSRSSVRRSRLEAVELLERVGVAAWKIASGEVGNLRSSISCCDRGGPVILSSGMSVLAEVDAAVARVQAAASRWPCCSARRPIRVRPIASA